MGATIQTHDALLKENFEDFIGEAVNEKNPLRDLIKFENVPYGGSEVSYPVTVDRGIAGTMFVGEDGAIADAANRVHAKHVIDQKKQIGRVRFTWEVMNDTSKGAYAYKAAQRDEMEGIVKDLARRDEAALSLDGRGVLARIDEGTPSGNTTLELDAPGGITNDNFGNRFIFNNMYLGAVNPASGTLRSGISKVSAVNSDGTDVTTAAAPNAAWANSDYIVQAAASDTTSILDTSWEQAWMGLMGLVDDGTYRTNYFGVNRDTYEAFKSYVVASTGALSMDLMQRVVDVVDQKLGGSINIILAHHSTRRLVLELQDSDRRYSGENLMRPDIGTRAMKQKDIPVGGIPIRALRDFPLDVMMFLDTEGSDFRQYTSVKGEWASESGSILKQVGTGSSLRDSFEAYYRRRHQNFMRNPGMNARLDGITGQTLVVVRAP